MIAIDNAVQKEAMIISAFFIGFVLLLSGVFFFYKFFENSCLPPSWFPDITLHLRPSPGPESGGPGEAA
jgi:RsiW-degrading membrane proteinase PrsW (M82 family)